MFIEAPALFLAADGARLPLAMLLIFGGAKLLAEIAERAGQPAIVGEILAGVLLGPSVLGWIAPNEMLQLLADLGVMFLLFRVGLEVKPAELLRVSGTAALVAAAGVVLPFILGWGILSLWGLPQIEAIFTGAALVATSVGITARVLAAKGLLAARASQIILAAAVIDDVLGLLVLSLVSGLARGRFSLPELGLTTLLAAAFVVVLARWGSRAAGRVAPRVSASLRLEDSEFALAMVALFALSLAAVHVGVSAIVGAFLAGMAFGDSAGPRVRHLTQGAAELLVPFFLAGIGLQTDLSVFRDSSTLLLTLAILAAALVSKFLGCGLGALRLGRRDAVRIGVGMIPRGEVGMVVAQIGLAMGVVSKPVYGAVVAMAVATTMVAPGLLRLAYRDIEPAPAQDEELSRLG